MILVKVWHFVWHSSWNKDIYFISINLVAKTLSLLSISNMSDVAPFLLEMEKSTLVTLENWVCSFLISCIFNSGYHSRCPNTLKKRSQCVGLFFIIRCHWMTSVFCCMNSSQSLSASTSQDQNNYSISTPAPICIAPTELWGIQIVVHWCNSQRMLDMENTLCTPRAVHKCRLFSWKTGIYFLILVRSVFSTFACLLINWVTYL